MSDYTDPWHTLTVIYEGEPEVAELELDHPAECPKPKRGPCCCKQAADMVLDYHSEIPAGSRLSCGCHKCKPFVPCPACAHENHDGCMDNELGYRCGTDVQVYEYGGENELDELAAGTYRVRGWSSGPDHNGEYDGGLTIEEVAA